MHPTLQEKMVTARATPGQRKSHDGPWLHARAHVVAKICYLLHIRRIHPRFSKDSL